MSHDDLATLLRHDIARDEPRWLPDVTVPISTGRRVVRRRRALGGAAATALAVAGVVSVPLLVQGDPAGRVLDPAEQALAEYDAQQMPTTLEEHSRAVLERSVPDLGPADFEATDGQGDALPQDLYDKASGMSVSYGDFEHSWSVTLNHAKSEAESSARKYCETGLAEGYYLECTVATDTHDNIVITKLWALKPMGGKPSERLGFLVVNAGEVDTISPDRLYFERTVKVIKSETLVTYVDEQVHASDRAAAEAAFQVPVEDLAELGSDPALVIPEPPTDDSGCGPWTQDDGVTYSC